MSLVGESVQRVEDARILSGRGSYFDDLKLPGALTAAFVRSPIAHGRIRRVDVEAARAYPGVVAVFTAEDVAERCDPLTVELPALNFAPPPVWPLARDKVRLVGDPIVLVVAQTRAVAEDACDLVDVELEPLGAVPCAVRAQEPGSPLVFDELDSNVLGEGAWDYGDVDGAFAASDRVVSLDFDQHRWANVPLEGRGIIASYDPGTDELTVHAPTQGPHYTRAVFAQQLRHPLHRVRVLCGDIGGSFGLKSGMQREYVAVAVASMALGRPVKWTEDRGEHLAASGHAREESVSVDAAVRDDGTVLGLRVRVVMDSGAYPNWIPSALFSGSMRILLPGPYRFVGYRFEFKSVATNKCTYVAFRGPWAFESLLREVLFDLIARELDLDPVDLRRLNTIRLDEQPSAMVTGPTHKGMTGELTLEQAAELIGYDAFRTEQARAREQGRYLGIGIATFVEGSPGPPDFRTAVGFGWMPERAEARIEPDGTLTVITAQQPHGQGHETTIAQVAADELGVRFEDVRVVAGDTMVTPFSVVGTGGSRAATMASGATRYSVRAVKRKAFEIAAHMLEANVEDLELLDGNIAVRGAPQSAVPLGQVARAAHFAPHLLPPDMPPGLTEVADYKPEDSGWAVATHACTVEVDPETGCVDILRYVVAEDCGEMINPAIVEGQVRGGTVHGVSATLLEHAAYAAEGALLADTFQDYLLPTSMDVPQIEIAHLESPPIGEINFRGVGEGGAVGAPPAVTNAVVDALAPFGGMITALPITPERVLQAIGARTPAQPG